MRDPFDAWYVRLPDGRVVRAKTTASVRHHLETGQIPSDSWVRRSGEDDWSSLEWTLEFADLVSARRKQDAQEAKAELERADKEQARLEHAAPDRDLRQRELRSRHELRTVGVRGLVDELMAALDSTLNRRKLTIAGVTCLAVAGVLTAIGFVDFTSGDFPWPWVGWSVSGLAQIAIVAVATALLTQMTFVELSRYRQAHRTEVLGRLRQLAARIAGCYLLIGGAVLLAIFGLRILPGWVLAQAVIEPIPTIALIASLVLEVLLWPVLGLCLLLGPVVVIEDSGLIQSIVLWWSLIRRNLGRVLLYEGLALALAAVMTVPFLLPVSLAGSHPLASSSAAAMTLFLLGGCALTPLVGYLIVANVFIYLNLRYEFSASARD